jgi:tight adherence protein B
MPSIPIEWAAAIPGVVVAGGLMVLFLGLSRPRPDVAPVPWMQRLNQVTSPLTERLEQRREARKLMLRADRRIGTSERLARADLNIRALEFHLIQLSLALLLGVIGLLRFGLGLESLLLLLAGVLVPEVYIWFRQNRRQRAFENQLPDVLQLLANGLRVGHSFLQASEGVARSAKPPASEEFARAAREMSLGGSIEDALESMRRRLPSSDVDLMVTAISVHHAIGGNLAQILEGLADTMVERVRMKGEMEVLTSQARASGMLISLLPVAVAAFLYLITPTYFRPMTTSPFGWAMLLLAATGIVVGNVLIRRINALEDA